MEKGLNSMLFMDTDGITINKMADAAEQILDGSGIDLIQAAILAMELVRECKGRGDVLKRARMGIRLGSEALKKSGQSVTFERALQETLQSKSHRRLRTLRDVKYTMEKLLRECPDLKKRHMRSISTKDCLKYLERGFSTERQRHKGRVILNGIFTMAHKRGWCEENPVSKVDVPPILEREIHSLLIEEVETLLKTSLLTEFSSCAPGLGLMIYGGIRPTETLRLRWGDINLKEKIVSILPAHSKTGGMRHVTVYPVLERWLRPFCNGKDPDALICIPSWPFIWKALRRKAGWGTREGEKPWPQDCLRHSYASYHAKYFRNFSELQIEMGHRSSALLRTRYLNMRGVTKESAERFWKGIL